jgi:acetyl esterase/lipase
MLGTTLIGLRHTLYAFFRPTIDFFVCSHTPWERRWRLLLLQPINFLTYFISEAPWILKRKPWTVEYIPIAPHRNLRVLVFKSESKNVPEGKLRPLHLDMHAGAFIGGAPEVDAKFCNEIAVQTGAIVLSTTYRLAPRHPFPAAIDDVDALVRYLQEHAAKKYGADPKLMTTSGFSAGANLALAVTQQANTQDPAETSIKGTVTYYGSIDLRLKPEDKPKPENFPKTDPTAVFLPLYDSYPAPMRKENMENPRMSPVLANLESLPKRILLIVPLIDILVHEQLTFVERLREEAEKHADGGKWKIETKIYEKGFHGWLECKSFSSNLE